MGTRGKQVLTALVGLTVSLAMVWLVFALGVAARRRGAEAEAEAEAQADAVAEGDVGRRSVEIVVQ